MYPAHPLRFLRSLRAPGVLAGYAFAGFTIVRLTLFLRFEDVGSDNAGQIGASFAIGALEDASVAVLFAMVLRAPFALFAALPWRSIGAVLAHGFAILVAAVTAFACVAEIVFWDEFDSRFNGIAVSYLVFPREVIGNIEESYDASRTLPLFIAVALVLWWPLRRRIRDTLAQRSGRGFVSTAATILVATATLVFFAGTFRPAFVDRDVDQLSRNGWHTFVTAALTNDADYAGVYPGLDVARAIAVLRAAVTQDNTRFLENQNQSPVLRHIENGPAEKHLNIVMVTEESFGSVFVDSLDNKLGVELSPDLDRLAVDGLFFTNIYAQGDRTVRGLEATETSFAPIPGISTARRPNADGMMSLAHLLGQRGYETGVLYGGLATFDNMATFWKGIDYRYVWDQLDIRHDSFKTIWGVSDQDLFTEAIERMDEMTAGGKPAFLTMMTVSNHRPYKFPEGKITWDDRVGRIQNTARYAQWAFADFIERSRGKAWFADTVFVFVADHSVKINGAARVPVNAFRIPMLFYSPAHITPQRVDTLGAQIDLVPTLLGVLGFSYDSPFFGVDLLKVPPDAGRFAMAHNFSIAYGRHGHVVVLEPGGKIEGYAFEPGIEPLTPEVADPETLELAVAQTQEAHRAFYARRYHWR